MDLTFHVNLNLGPATLALAQQFVGIFNPQPNPQLDRIEAAIAQLQKEETQIMADLTALTAQVTSNTDAEASAVQLLTNLSGLLNGMKTDPAAIAALAAQLKSSGDALAAAIVANTPAAPPVA